MRFFLVLWTLSCSAAMASRRLALLLAKSWTPSVCRTHHRTLATFLSRGRPFSVMIVSVPCCNFRLCLESHRGVQNSPHHLQSVLHKGHWLFRRSSGGASRTTHKVLEMAELWWLRDRGLWLVLCFESCFLVWLLNILSSVSHEWRRKEGERWIDDQGEQ